MDKNIMIPYKLFRSRRKTIAIHIKKDATVEIRAPLKMAVTDIEKFIESKEAWIQKYIGQRKQLNAEKSGFALNYGDTVTLAGNTYPISPREGNVVGFDGKCFYIPPDLPPNEIKDAVIQIYKAAARNIMKKKTAEYAKHMNVTPASVKVTDAKTRWGSCSGTNRINFSWRLVMADNDVINYIVVHELAHIIEHNHSPRFWKVVEIFMPDYREMQKKLKIFQQQHVVQNWD